MNKCLAPLEDRVRNRSVFVFEEAAFRPDSEPLDPEAAEDDHVAAEQSKGKGKKSRQQQRVQVHFYWIIL